MEDEINLSCKESIDFQSSKSGSFVPEFEGFTPLMLAVVSEKASLDTVK